MGTAVEKTAEELRKEIEELHRQQWEITERLRDPRGLRRGALPANGPRNFANGGRQRGLVRPADRVGSDDQTLAKRRLSSAVVKLEDGEMAEEAEGTEDVKEAADGTTTTENESDRRSLNPPLQRGGFRKDGNPAAKDLEIPTEQVPRVLPKNEDPSLVNRNKRMLGQLLGTLEAEQRAREENERLWQQEREQIAEKRRRDLTLRARVAAKAEEKKLELLFLRWSEHHKKLCNYLRTNAEPPIYYMPVKPLEEDATLAEEHKEKAYQEWKAARREELSEYQKQIAKQYVANVETELERWQNARNARKENYNLNQETMDNELETHRLEHGPKTRKILDSGNNDDEDDVEDINVGEDDMMDDVLGVDDNSRRVDESLKPEEGNASPNPDNVDQ
ncbi:pinin-like [Telopea speciosissima]|uniref:pinin-like n=1 Tax=Telopea speciosissima TaxID=54955 RepID=UPI001CC5F959|nr:pinin-like [Telopea speciosissima]